MLRKNNCPALLLVLVLLGFVIVSNFNFGSASTAVGGLIKENQTWTKNGSPYNLIGSLAVNKGVALTIEPGVIVNINDYYIQVNGTLIARGSGTEKITINSNQPYDEGSIRFTDVSPGWNEQTNTGNIFENCLLNNIMIVSANAVKLNRLSFTNLTDGIPAARLGNSSIVTNSEIHGSLELGDYSVVTNNLFGYNSGVICGSYHVGSFLTITDNSGGWFMAHNSTIANNKNIAGNTGGYGCLITGNTISGSVSGEYIANNRIDGDVTATVVTGNTVTAKGQTAVSGAIVFNNTIIGGGLAGHFDPYKGGWSQDHWVGAVGTGGNAVISNNVIVGGITGGGSPQIVNNTITGSIAIGNDYNYFEGTTNAPIADSVTISANTIVGDNYCGVVVTARSISINGNQLYNSSITVQAQNASVRNNALYTSGQGVQVTKFGSTTLIERNLLSNSFQGVLAYAGTTIQNNTFLNCTIAVNGNPTLVAQNNIQQTGQYGIHLLNSDNVAAANNWWGTTEQAQIDKLIYDSNCDFNLGTVNYKPILTLANTQALPDLTVKTDISIVPTVPPSTPPSTQPTTTPSNPSDLPPQTASQTPTTTTSTDEHTSEQTTTPESFPLLVLVSAVATVVIAALAVTVVLLARKIKQKPN